MAMSDRDEALDGLFAQARDLAPSPSDDLIARILADAEAVAAQRRAPVQPEPGGWRTWLESFGGWPAMGGLAAATVAGLWIGVARPTAIPDLGAAVWGEGVSVAVGLDEDPLGLLEG